MRSQSAFRYVLCERLNGLSLPGRQFKGEPKTAAGHPMRAGDLREIGNRHRFRPVVGSASTDQGAASPAIPEVDLPAVVEQKPELGAGRPEVFGEGPDLNRLSGPRRPTTRESIRER